MVGIRKHDKIRILIIDHSVSHVGNENIWLYQYKSSWKHSSLVILQEKLKKVQERIEKREEDQRKKKALQLKKAEVRKKAPDFEKAKKQKIINKNSLHSL